MLSLTDVPILNKILRRNFAENKLTPFIFNEISQTILGKNSKMNILTKQGIKKIFLTIISKNPGKDSIRKRFNLICSEDLTIKF